MVGAEWVLTAAHCVVGRYPYACEFTLMLMLLPCIGLSFIFREQLGADKKITTVPLLIKKFHSNYLIATS